MSKYSDFKEWMAANTAKTEEEKVALIDAALTDDGSAAEMLAESQSGETAELDLSVAALCITYADHVTAKLQAEIDALKSELAERSKDDFKKGWGWRLHENDPVSEYVDGYYMVCEGDAEYTPTDFEKVLILDAMHGYDENDHVQPVKTETTK